MGVSISGLKNKNISDNDYYYLTYMSEQKGEKGTGMVFRDPFEAMMAYEVGKVSLQTKIKVRISNRVKSEIADEQQDAQYEAGGKAAK